MSVFRSLSENYVSVLLAAALFYSVSQISIKVLSKTTSVFQILSIRSAFVILVVGLYIHRGDGKYFGDKKTHGLLLIRALSGALAFICMTVATYLLPLVDSAFLQNSYPATTALISFVLGIDQPTVLCCMGIFGCLLGEALVIRPPFLFGGHDEDWDIKRVVGIIIALLSQFFTSVTFILIGRIGPSVSSASHSLVHSMAMFTISVPFLPTKVPKPFDWKLSLNEFGLYVLVALSAILFQPLMNRGFQLGPPTKTGAIFLTNMLYSAAFGIVVLSDDYYYGTFIGTAILIISIIVVNCERSRKLIQSQETINLEANGHETKHLYLIEDDPSSEE